MGVVALHYQVWWCCENSNRCSIRRLLKTCNYYKTVLFKEVIDESNEDTITPLPDIRSRSAAARVHRRNDSREVDANLSYLLLMHNALKVCANMYVEALLLVFVSVTF